MILLPYSVHGPYVVLEGATDSSSHISPAQHRRVKCTCKSEVGVVIRNGTTDNLWGAEDHARRKNGQRISGCHRNRQQFNRPATHKQRSYHESEHRSSAEAAKTKWFLGDKELAATETYVFSSKDEGGKRTLLRCEIKNFDKPLAGEYKAKFYSGDGENSATFTVQAGNAPEFHDKPHIVQRDGGNVIVIKVRAKSHLEMKAEWFKNDKPVKFDDRIKSVVKKDDKDKEGFQYLLEITGPKKEDEGKYKCVVKNAEGQNEQSLNLCFD
uniref:Ig-like domain-containing protein n=1 Tax=Ascaris lumbricoides TaxID=6252 RepID=A0A9J2PLP3_ASCLU